MSLADKLNQYNQYFGFREHPEDFNFELSPERELYKNEALRNNDRELYVNYLAENYAREMEIEMHDFDAKRSAITQVTEAELRAIMSEKKTNLLVSDIDFHDQDAIFTLIKVNVEYIPWHIEDNEDDLLNTTVTIEQAFKGKSQIYIVQ